MKKNLEKCEKAVKRSDFWGDTTPYYNCKACKKYGCWNVPSPCDDGLEGWRDELIGALTAVGGEMISVSIFRGNVAQFNSKIKG